MSGVNNYEYEDTGGKGVHVGVFLCQHVYVECVHICIHARMFMCMGREGVPTSREEEITQQVRERLSFISNRQTDMLQIPATAALNRPAKTPQENTLEETQTLTHSQRLCVSVCVRMFLCLSLLSSVNESVCVCASCVCFKLSFTLCVCVCSILLCGLVTSAELTLFL